MWGVIEFCRGVCNNSPINIHSVWPLFYSRLISECFLESNTKRNTRNPDCIFDSLLWDEKGMDCNMYH